MSFAQGAPSTLAERVRAADASAKSISTGFFGLAGRLLCLEGRATGDFPGKLSRDANCPITAVKQDQESQ